MPVNANGQFLGTPPWWKTAPPKRPIKRSMKIGRLGVHKRWLETDLTMFLCIQPRSKRQGCLQRQTHSLQKGRELVGHWAQFLPACLQKLVGESFFEGAQNVKCKP